MASSLDLRTLLANRYRDKTIDTLLLNLFNRHLSKTDTVPLFGYIGDQINLQAGEVQITEATLERQINQLTPFIYAKHASEDLMFSWYDIIQKLYTLGVDYTTIQDWFKSSSYNFAPPIDLDKFCNFQDYFWIGTWMLTNPTIDYSTLGIPKLAPTQANPTRTISEAFSSWNNSIINQEYYVISRATLDGSGLPVSPQPLTFPAQTWSDWSYTNLWVHRDDVLNFIQSNGITFNSAAIIQATRPIIEYSCYVGLNTAQAVDGSPIYTGAVGTLPTKVFTNQLPLFDLYHYDGNHAGITSSTFYYLEGQEYSIDPIIGRRIAVDANGDYIFAHAFVNQTDQSLYFYRLYDPVNAETFQTIWRKGATVAPQYSKLNTAGTIINQDMFVNYANYYWTGVDAVAPAYNPTGLPEYYVIEKSAANASDWSIYNYWTHVSNLKRNELSLYVQATKPIIEFNYSLESELIGSKTSYGQLPKFKQYIYDQDDSKYQLIPYVDDITDNDAYLTGHLFARLSDLDEQVQVAITTNSVILSNNTFQYGGVTYVQGLYNGAYYAADQSGNNYGFKARNVTYNGIGDGTLNISDVTNTIPELITFTFNGTNFDVNGSVTGWMPPVDVGTISLVGPYYPTSGCTVNINRGATDFQLGDKFMIEVSSYVFNQRNMYVNISNIYRTVTSPGEIITEVQNLVVVPSNPALKDGVWSPAPQVEWNLINETRTQISEGDLYYHFTSIIASQPNLVGSSTGDNNWRKLQQNVGLGGTIKQFDGDAALLISTLIQQGLSISALIDFAKSSYESLSTSISQFVTDVIPDLLVNGQFTPPTGTDTTIDQSVIDAFKTYFAAQNSVVIASPSVVDDYVSSPFYDTTSSLFNLVVTLPYIGLAPKVLPKKYLDPDLNLNMLIHHDGHETQLSSDLSNIAKQIVKKLYLRSPGQETPGIVSGFNWPSKPYAGQFWFKTTTSQLFMYDAVCDDAVVVTNDPTLTIWASPSDPTYVIAGQSAAPYGSYAYNRSSGEIFQNNGVDSWAYMGTDLADLILPWKEIQLDLIAQNLELAIETELYNKCPTLQERLDVVTLKADIHYNSLMTSEFKKFGVIHGVVDVGTYGDLTNQIYVFWTKTLDYLYSQQRTYFRIDPLQYVRETWGTKHSTVGDYTFAPLLGRKEAPSDFTLHQSALTAVAQPGWVTASSNNNNDQTFTFDYTFTCVNRQEGIFSLVISNDFAASIVYPGSPPTVANPMFVQATSPLFNVLNYVDPFINVNISSSLRGFFWGDSFTVSMDVNGVCTVSIQPQTYFKAEGFNQLFVQYGRIYGEDVQISINSTLLTDWEVKLGYRFSSLTNTDTLLVDVQDTAIASSAYNIYVKENDFYNSSWIDALRVQLVQRGSTAYKDGINIPAIGPNGTPGEDWIFRVDNFNKNKPSLSWYSYDMTGPSTTFIAVDGKVTAFPWTRYKTLGTVQTFSSPFLITGIQNFINFIEGYSDKMYADGWRFTDPNDPLPNDTGVSNLGYQPLIEQFIVQQFSGVTAGSAFLFNPFNRKVWYDVPHGMLSNIFNVLGFDTETTCAILDENGKQVPNGSIRAFRQDELTELIFDDPVYTLHVLTSEFEHVMLFENYSTNTLLIYDPFLGQRSTRVFLEGQKQANFTGKIDFGGHFLLGDEMKKNLENSVDGILGLYDTSAKDVDATSLNMSRSLLGYQKKNYFKNRNSTDATQFRFWQGMIANKGTNFSINAYINSASYQDAQLQEYWAYKIAEYGDSRSIVKAEMIVQPDDCTGEYANYIFMEADDIQSNQSSNDISDFYDYVPYDYSGYSSSTLVDTSGLTQIIPGDEARWYSYSDLNKISYLEAATIGPLYNDGYLNSGSLSTISVGDCFVIRDFNGKPVNADCFEILNSNSTSASAQVFRESGDYIVGSNPPQFMFPRFTRLNRSTIKILDLGGISTNPGSFLTGVQYTILSLGDTNWTACGFVGVAAVGASFTATSVGSGTGTAETTRVTGTLQVVAYGPATHQYSPNLLYDYVDNVLVDKSIIWWDPARGIHNPRAAASISFDDEKDPALYTNSICQFKNANTQKYKPWGSKQVGKIWWNTKNLSWQPYSDEREFQLLFDRINGWGALSDESSIEVYEWVESSTPPSTAATGTSMTGEPAIANYVQRNRTWWQRPIAWRYSSNPDLISRLFLAYQPYRLQILASNGTGQAVLQSGSFDDLGITIGTKITGANYSSVNKQDSNLTSIFGLATISSDSSVVVGSQTGYADGALMQANTIISNLTVTVDVNVLRFRDSYLSSYVLTNPSGNNLLLTHVASGISQQLLVIDVASNQNPIVYYDFDQLGIKLACTLFTTPTTAVDVIASLLPTQIYLRSTVNVDVPIIFSSDGILPATTVFSSNADAQTLGWVAWNDPTSNPNQGVKPPLNQYSPLAGNWTQVGTYLHDVSDDIVLRISDPWTWFDGSDFTPYKSSWTPWAVMESTIIEEFYEFVQSNPSDIEYTVNTSGTSFSNLFTFVGVSAVTLLSRCSVYLNGKKLTSSEWSIGTNGSNPTIIITSALLKQGDIVRAVLAAYVPTVTDLAFDPSVSDTDPFQLVQYALDIPYVMEVSRDSNDNLTINNYYYWAKNKTTIGAPNQLSTTSVTQLLTATDGIYAIPQRLKYYNQLDNRPNRYSILSIKGLGSEVRAVDRYKLRFDKDPTLRDRDENISLKPVFTEWKLLRQGQLDLIPIALWNTLTDTLCGSTKLNQPLPYVSLALYDNKNGTSVSYGIDDGQIMDKASSAIATVKYTILNTQVDKYQNGVLVPDYISYAGFDISKLDSYFVSVSSIRQFMSDLWRYAKATQVNEIFFAALQDMAANDLEIDNFFKTSFISLSDVKTIISTIN